MKRLVVVAGLFGCGEVLEEPPPAGTVTVAVTQNRAFVRQGETVDVDLTVTRDGADGALDVTIDGEAPGLSAMALQIPAGETAAQLHLVADATATQGAVQATVTVTAVDDAAVTATSDPFRLLVGGQPGTLDTSFAQDGTFTPSLGGLAMASRGLVFTAKGLVVTGFVDASPAQAITVRVLEDGSLDPMFGSSGFVSTGFGGLAEGIAIALANNGDLVVAGIAGGGGVNPVECDFGLFRYDTTGALVASFGQSGVATFNPGTAMCAEWHNVAIAMDGSIFAGGMQFATGTGGTTAGRAFKYSPMGVKDNAFNVSETVGDINGSVLQDDGKLVMVGLLSNDFWVARYNPNGTHDTGFGTNGIVTTDFGTTVDEANGVLLLPGGKLLVVGTTTVNSVKVIASAQYNANGSLDATYGTGGKAITTTSFETRSGTGLVQSGDKIYFVGRRIADKKPAIARLNADGTMDTEFGTNGVAVVDFGIAGTTNSTGGFGLAVDPDGRVLISGDVGPPAGQQMAIARLWF